MGAPRASPPPGGPVPGEPHAYTVPARLGLNQWALSGEAAMEEEATTLNAANGQIACRFRARDLNLVMGPAAPGTSLRFRAGIDGQPPGEAHGTGVDSDGNGTVTYQRVYQLIRQPGPITERTFEITFPDPEVRPTASPSARREQTCQGSCARCHAVSGIMRRGISGRVRRGNGDPACHRPGFSPRPRRR